MDVGAGGSDPAAVAGSDVAGADAGPRAGVGGSGPAAVRPYEFVSSRDLDRRARELVDEGRIVTWLVRTTRAESLKIEGPCARCGDPFTQTQVLELPVTKVRGWRLNRAPRDDRSADFLCDCSVVHPGTPDGATGCGASYTVVSVGRSRG